MSLFGRGRSLVGASFASTPIVPSVGSPYCIACWLDGGKPAAASGMNGAVQERWSWPRVWVGASNMSPKCCNLESPQQAGCLHSCPDHLINLCPEKLLPVKREVDEMLLDVGFKPRVTEPGVVSKNDADFDSLKVVLVASKAEHKLELEIILPSDTISSRLFWSCSGRYLRRSSISSHCALSYPKRRATKLTIHQWVPAPQRYSLASSLLFYSSYLEGGQRQWLVQRYACGQCEPMGKWWDLPCNLHRGYLGRA